MKGIEMTYQNNPQTTGFRELSPQELEAISEGGNAGGAGDGITVNGDRWGWDTTPRLSSHDWYSLWDNSNYEVQPPYDQGGGEDPCLCNVSVVSDSQYPEDFDHELDKKVDRLAADIAKEFLNQPTAATHEAIALIWVDGAGNVQRTGVHVGVPYWAPIELCYPEVDFANGGKIVGIIHSHPSHYQSGAGLSAVGNDIHALSNTDFDTLLGAANGKYGGFDNVNIRSYIAQNGAVQEYYAFDQDASQIGQDDSRTVDSVRSTDFYENAGQCACP
jgi:hypothetical protein